MLAEQTFLVIALCLHQSRRKSVLLDFVLALQIKLYPVFCLLVEVFFDLKAISLPVFVYGCDKARTAASARVYNHITLIGKDFNELFNQLNRLLRWVDLPFRILPMPYSRIDFG